MVDHVNFGVYGGTVNIMYDIALKMLIGDRAKFLGLIFAFAFSSFLISHQASIFAGVMARTANQIYDVWDADLWVMDAETLYFDELKAVRESFLYDVRGVDGVQWAVRHSRATPRAIDATGRYRVVIMLGLDDATLAGAPPKVVLGDVNDLRQPDAIMMDRAGYGYFFPGEPLRLGRVLELNDRRARIVAISDAAPPFVTFPVCHARYSVAVNFQGQERNTMTAVLVKVRPGHDPEAVAAAIRERTGLKAFPTLGFAWATISFYLKNTGIPVNFGITIFIAILVGAVVAGQTFYLFVLEKLSQFAALKAIGVTSGTIGRMIVLQAVYAGFIGYSFGILLCALFFLSTKDVLHLRGFILYWQVAVGTAGLMAGIILASCALSVRKVMGVEPAMVFR